MMRTGMNNYRATAHMTVTSGYSMIIHSNVRHHKPRPLHHQNQPGLPDFSRLTLKNVGRPGYKATLRACAS